MNTFHSSPFIVLLILLLGLSSCSKGQEAQQIVKKNRTDQVVKSEDEWKKELTAKEFNILRKKGTEPAFSGKYWNNEAAGTYHCAGCHQPLFDAKSKFESGTGWPSFYEPIDHENIEVVKDMSMGMAREEVLCARCGGHLGHVFPDGPEPTGLRYCLNSAALDFEKR